VNRLATFIPARIGGGQRQWFVTEIANDFRLELAVLHGGHPQVKVFRSHLEKQYSCQIAKWLIWFLRGLRLCNFGFEGSVFAVHNFQSRGTGFPTLLVGLDHVPSNPHSCYHASHDRAISLALHVRLEGLEAEPPWGRCLLGRASAALGVRPSAFRKRRDPDHRLGCLFYESLDDRGESDGRISN